MRSLITGSGGFVGKYLIDFLKSQGHEVFGIERHYDTSEIKTFVGDILDKEFLKKVFEEVNPDYIFHLAAQASVALSFKEPEITMKINVEGTRNIFDTVLEVCPDSKILLTCSADSYGLPNSLEPITEEHPSKALNPYAESKILAEKLAIEYVKKNSLKVIITRSFPHTGPGQSEMFVCSSFAKQIAENEKNNKTTIKVGNLDAKRDFLDVRDVVKAYSLALEKCKSGVPYNISSGKAYSIKEILDMLLSMSSIKMKIELDPERMRPSDIPILLGDSTRFKQQTNWKPDIKFEQTLKDLLEWWRQRI